MKIDIRLLKIAKKLIDKKSFVPKHKDLWYEASLKEWVATDSMILMRHIQEDAICDFDFSISWSILDTIKVKDNDTLFFELQEDSIKVIVNWEFTQQIPIKKDSLWINLKDKRLDWRLQESGILGLIPSFIYKFIGLCKILADPCVAMVKETIIDIDEHWFYICTRK